MRARRLLAAPVLLAALWAAPASAAPRLEAKVWRTKYGVPHVEARTWRSLGYGFAYAFAQDDLCTIADQYVTVSAQRSRWFGPDRTWTFGGNGSVNDNLDSDFYWARIDRERIVEKLVARRPPNGPKREVRELVAGYVAGYNRYLREVGVRHLPDPRCRGKGWVRPIRAIDVYRRFYQLASLASSGVAIDGIGGAAPVAPAGAAAAHARQRDALAHDLPRLKIPIGSNAYGIGGAATDNGMGMVLGNPHFPWAGSERLYQAQLRIPGRLDVSGATLYGVPLILIGHTHGLAWSHTVATAWRFTPFALQLVPGDPHSYLVDGREEHMKPIRLTVDGHTRTLYDTRYGPVFTSLLGIPLFPWTPTTAYALGDVNATNFRYLNHFLDNDRAQSVRAYDRIERRYQGVPWVNSIAADRSGQAYYTMDGPIPNVTDAKARACDTAIGAGTYAVLDLPVLDGSRSACGWGNDRDAAAPGIFGPSHVPTLWRRDYVYNGNDSHWLTNARVRLEGFAPIVGDERTARSLRTRLGLLQAEQRLAGTDGLPGRRFTLRDLERITLGDRQYAGELWRGPLVDWCRAHPLALGTSGLVDIRAACPVLAAWNAHDDLDSHGALLFRRFVEHVFPYSLPDAATIDVDQVTNPWLRPFSVSDPVNTPSGLNTLNPVVATALPDAVQDLRKAGIPLDAGLRGYQYVTRQGKKISIPGGPDTDGNFNAINVPWSSPRGYPDVPNGSSFIMAVQFRRGRCPVREGTFVTYGESENPHSPHDSDYTRAFSAKRWNAVPTCWPAVRRDATSLTTLATGRRTVTRRR